MFLSLRPAFRLNYAQKNTVRMGECMVKELSIILVTGIMASGKSTVAQLLSEKFDKSVHLRGVAGTTDCTSIQCKENKRED
ncbi:hypothetical protein DFP97_1184 [Paenibacillus prosopidis]|uniref:AAA domain-containing protein n=1 Tax=Paenibacillus prosopidis TaxID=630520 RepID=A0A368VMD2_9BACL|nr:hypothetical protein DFP97_1184 [Paenibacillus prosopidis]